MRRYFQYEIVAAELVDSMGPIFSQLLIGG